MNMNPGKSKWIIWGTGKKGQELYDYLLERGDTINVTAVVDISEKKWGDNWNGYLIENPDILLSYDFDKLIIAVEDWKSVYKYAINQYKIQPQKLDNCYFIQGTIGRILYYSEKVKKYPVLWWMVQYFKIKQKHKKREIRKGKKYYIFGYDDPQSSGWTVWERVVLYNSMYAVDHGMIPVVDMQNYKNIYLEDDEIGCVNAWEKFYYQPGGVLLEEAIASNDYIIADSSYEWFCYIRERHPYKYNDNEFLRKEFNKYIILRQEIKEELNDRLKSILPEIPYAEDARMLSICLRGSDYKIFHHPKQPDIKYVVELAENIFEQYKCDYYFIATEDMDIFTAISSMLPSDKCISYKAGNIKNIDGLAGLQIRKTKSANEAAMDYLTILYLMNQSCCLIGGVCGATAVAKYRRNSPYEYMNIIDTHEIYL